MVTTAKTPEAKTHLSSLVARAVAVEDKPKPKRVSGALVEQISIPDRFFEPMSEEELRLW